MARSGDDVRKIIAFDPESWTALKLLSSDSMKSLQELMNEAVSDLLKKHGRPALLKDALRQSIAAPAKGKQSKRSRRG